MSQSNTINSALKIPVKAARPIQFLFDSFSTYLKLCQQVEHVKLLTHSVIWSMLFFAVTIYPAAG